MAANAATTLRMGSLRSGCVSPTTTNSKGRKFLAKDAMTCKEIKH